MINVHKINIFLLGTLLLLNSPAWPKNSHVNSQSIGSVDQLQTKEETSQLRTETPGAKAESNKSSHEKEYIDKAIADAKLDAEKQSISNREKTFDILIKILAFFLAGFSLLITLVLAVAGFLGYRELSSIRKRVDDDFDAYKKHLNQHIEEQISGVRVQEIISKTINATFGQPTEKVLERLNRLERHVKDLTDAVRGGYAPPDLQVEDIPEEPEETTNPFDEQ